MKSVGIGIVGFLIGVALCVLVFLDRQYEVNAAVARVQGKVDVMNFYCKSELERVGLINKEKKDAK